MEQFSGIQGHACLEKLPSEKQIVLWTGHRNNPKKKVTGEDADIVLNHTSKSKRIKLYFNIKSGIC